MEFFFCFFAQNSDDSVWRNCEVHTFLLVFFFSISFLHHFISHKVENCNLQSKKVTNACENSGVIIYVSELCSMHLQSQTNRRYDED